MSFGKAVVIFALINVAPKQRRLPSLKAILSLAEILFSIRGESTIRVGVEVRMKEMDVEKEGLWPTQEQVEKARGELHQRIMDEELCSLRREAVDGLMTLLRVDRESLRTLWIRPLVTAGATFDMALACIAESVFRPN